jgi:hypothetical protein
MNTTILAVDPGKFNSVLCYDTTTGTASRGDGPRRASDAE